MPAWRKYRSARSIPCMWFGRVAEGTGREGRAGGCYRTRPAKRTHEFQWGDFRACAPRCGAHTPDLRLRCASLGGSSPRGSEFGL